MTLKEKTILGIKKILFRIKLLRIIDDAGFFVDCENIDKFASALFTASKVKCSDISLEQAKKFSWNLLKSKYEKVIEEVAG